MLLFFTYAYAFEIESLSTLITNPVIRFGLLWNPLNLKQTQLAARI